MSISTRRGDSGKTEMLFGKGVQKNHPRIHAMGEVDELNAALGLVRLTAVSDTVAGRIPAIQRELIQLMGELATPKGEESRYARVHPQHINEESVARLDSLVLEMEENDLVKSSGWALPGEGGVFSAAYCDLARTICRRAERSVVSLMVTPNEVPNPNVVKFLNRLSDVLWLMARVETKLVLAQVADGSQVRTETGMVQVRTETGIVIQYGQ